MTRRAHHLARTMAALLAAATLAGVSGCTSQPAAGPSRTSSTPLRMIADKAGLRVGVAVNTDRLSDGAYAKLTGQQFSTVTPENVMKWEVVEPKQGQYDWSAADKLVDFAQAHGQLVRGHNLVWYSQLPQWLTDEAPSLSADQLSAILQKHITDEVTHFKGKIWQWDVVNEAFDDSGELRDNIWLEKLGPGYIADAFRWAHAADPDAKLFLNDYGIENNGIKSQAEYDLVKQLVADGVPIDGVGFETHLDADNPEQDLTDVMTQFAGLGIDVAVTEADVKARTPVSKIDQTIQSSMFADTMSACLAVKQCISYTLWDLDDKDSWIPQYFPGEGGATLYDDKLKPKPQYFALQSALAKGVKTAPQRSK